MRLKVTKIVTNKTCAQYYPTVLAQCNPMLGFPLLQNLTTSNFLPSHTKFDAVAGVANLMHLFIFYIVYHVSHVFLYNLERIYT